MNKKQMNGMVDVTFKDVTRRVARASSTVVFDAVVFHALMSDGSPKGDVFETAKVAGIMAAKATASIIPMCHPLALSKIQITFKVEKAARSVVTISEVICMGRTGVEMEALTAASVASLTIYDMMKWAGKGTVIAETKLQHKSGGKSGDFDA